VLFVVLIPYSDPIYPKVSASPPSMVLKKTSMSLPAYLGQDTRGVNKRYFRLWHNHDGRLNMHIITGHILCGFLISLNGLIPSVLSPNLIFLVSLEKSS
jgi:hypothetical protein